MPNSSHLEDSAVAVILLMKDWSNASAQSIARQKPAAVVVEVTGTAKLGILDMITQLSRLGVRVIALVDADPELEELCIGAGATPVVRENRPIHEILKIVELHEIHEIARRSHRARGAGSEQPHPLRRADDVQRSEKSLAVLAQLTRQEQNVLAALMQGQAVREIATSNVLSPLTVRSHVRSILLKLGVNSQLAAVALAHRSGWRPNALAASGRR
jgi:two-component system, NarL family, nitrate/nitrite response regulator NarL